MRFVAPAREAVLPSTFDHPAFARLQPHRDLLAAREWPTIAALDERLGARVHPRTGMALRFVAQTRELRDDGLHYEERIATRGEIATRERNWHDLLNALAWIEHTELKAALNLRQARDVALVGATTRTPGQCALTHFDEAGAIVVLPDRATLGAWDAHDWESFFAQPAPDVLVFGHALMEHALHGDAWLVAKCIAVVGDASTVPDAIASGALLDDPQALRPLPLCGLRGWHSRRDEPGFFATAPCFRPLRAGRVYPPPYATSITT
ncbi:MAG TPA: DUF3025 domain-containing protein [Xanthomonadales bacterium]|nr:DUF3025 domain-containing protein [Xanthomonadales bacterium]